MKIQEALVLLGIAASIVFVTTTLIHIVKNKRIGFTGKWLWGLAAIFLFPLATAYYFYWMAGYKRSPKSVKG
jgi:hypothetical protein